MALEPYALTTVGAVEEELGLTSGAADAYLERLIDAYSSRFIEATGRPWHRDDAYVESVISTGDTTIMVNRRPVRSITSIKMKGDEVDSDGYEIEDADAGTIRRIDQTWESTAVQRRRVEGYNIYYEKRVEVEYDGGYVTPKQAEDGTFATRDLPPDIESAVIDTVATAYRRKGSPSNVKSESIGSASISFATPSQASSSLGTHVSTAFESAVERYTDRSVIR